MEVAKRQDCRTAGNTQRVQRLDRRQRVSSGGRDIRSGDLPVDAQATVDIPRDQRPVVLPGDLTHFQEGVVVLVALNPDARECGADIFLEALAERHGSTPRCVYRLKEPWLGK